MKIEADIENMDGITLYSDSAYQIDVLTNILLCNGYEDIKITPATTAEIVEYQKIKGGLVEWNL